MANLTLDEMQRKKDVIEKWLEERLREFEKETGLRVESIEIDHILGDASIRSASISCRFPKNY